MSKMCNQNVFKRLHIVTTTTAAATKKRTYTSKFDHFKYYRILQKKEEATIVER